MSQENQAQAILEAIEEALQRATDYYEEQKARNHSSATADRWVANAGGTVEGLLLAKIAVKNVLGRVSA